MKVPLIVGFLALLALLGIDLVLTNRTVAHLERDQQRVRDLQAVRVELEALLRIYLDAETGQRGFIITGDESFLEPYHEAQARLTAGGGRLKAIFGDDAQLFAMRAEIDALGAKKWVVMERGIAARRAGGPEAGAAEVRNGEGKTLMDQMRRRAEEIDERKIREIEAVLRDSERAKWVAALRTTASSAILGSALIGLYFFARMHLQEREAAREAMSKALAGERAAHSLAAQANKMKDEFLALVSHELRTPLNAMLGWTSLLKEGAEDEKELREGLDTIDRNARAQARLVDDLLDVSRIISGKVRLVITEVNLRAVVASVIDALRPASTARGVTVEFRATSEPAEVLGDSDRLQQIVWNLLSNAIKFTPRGGRVTLSLEHRESTVALAVTDNGPGIRADFIPRIFERFSQGDASTTRGHGGLGLGLAITRHLIELHGGKISAESPGEGLGATFRVEIPIVAVKDLKARFALRANAAGAAAAPTVGPLDVDLAGRRVLAVDDQADTLAIINRILTRQRAEVRTATSAAAGLAILADWAPDLLISDIGMPGQDGYSFIRAVRALPKSSARRLPAVALTAFARESDRKAAIDAGFDEHLAKPIDTGMLLSKVAELLSRP